MKQNYKPLQPAVRCKHCGRLISTRSGKTNPHHPKADDRAMANLCPGSLLPIKEQA